MEPTPPPHTGPSRRARVATAAVLLSLGAAATALSFTQRVEKHLTDSFDLAAPASLRVDTDRVSDLAITGGAGTRVTIARRASWSGPDEPPIPRLEQGTLTLRACSPPWWVNFATWNQCSADVDLTVPATTALTVTGDVGDVRIGGTFASLSVGTDLGDVLVDGAAVARLQATTDVGDVDIRLTEIPDRVFIRSDIGDVTLTVPAGRYRVQTFSDIGDTNVDPALEDPTSARVIDIGAGIGDVTVRVAR